MNRLFLNLFMNQSLIHLNSEWGVYIEWITLEMPITRTHIDSPVRGSLLDLSINRGALSSEPVLNSAKVRIYSVFRKWKVPIHRVVASENFNYIEQKWLISTTFVSAGVLRGWCSVRNWTITSGVSISQRLGTPHRCEDTTDRGPQERSHSQNREVCILKIKQIFEVTEIGITQTRRWKSVTASLEQQLATYFNTVINLCQSLAKIRGVDECSSLHREAEHSCSELWKSRRAVLSLVIAPLTSVWFEAVFTQARYNSLSVFYCAFTAGIVTPRRNVSMYSPINIKTCDKNSLPCHESQFISLFSNN